MKGNFYFYIIILVVLICRTEHASADIKAYASPDGCKVGLDNKTNSAWIMGGVRFKNGGQDLKLQYGSAEIRKTGGNEYDVDYRHRINDTLEIYARGRTGGAGIYQAVIQVIDETGENAVLFSRSRMIGIKN